MSAPILTSADLARLTHERLRTLTDLGDPDSWLEEAGIEKTGVLEFGRLMATALGMLAEQDGLSHATAAGFAVTCFQVGWDAHFQTRGERA